MNKIICLLGLLLSIITTLSAQLKSLKLVTAEALVNTEVVAQAQPSVVKSSLSASAGIAITKGYAKTITVSYQIPALHALEWNTIRYRASSILDEHGFILFITNPPLYESIRALAENDFVLLSSQAPLTVKLNFKYNKTQPYRANGFAPINNSPVINTKSLLIKK